MVPAEIERNNRTLLHTLAVTLRRHVSDVVRFIGRRKLFQLKCLQLRFFRVFASSLALAQKTAARTNDRACGKGPFSGLEDDRVSQVPEREGQEQHRAVGQR